MKIKSSVLLAELNQYTEQHILQAEYLKKLPPEALNYRETPETWSILENLEHLNLYGDFYLPEIDRQTRNSSSSPTDYFTSGLLGNYFAKSMLPRQPLNKMKTFKDKNPLGSQLDATTIDRFLGQLQHMQILLENAATVNLTKVTTGITISSFLRLRLGDTLRVVIYHNERHMVKASTLKELVL